MSIRIRGVLLVTAAVFASGQIEAQPTKRPVAVPTLNADAEDRQYVQLLREAARDVPENCATRSPTPAAIRMNERNLSGAEKELQTLAVERITIPVYVWVITSNGRGDIRHLIPEQIRRMNAAFSDTVFIFELKQVQRVENPTWYHLEVASSEKAAKQALRNDGPSTLNFYTGYTGDPDENGSVVTGWISDFPDDSIGWEDGIVVRWSMIPASTTSVSAKSTAIHETGHWLGLYHTFQGRCGTGNNTTSGDRVADTWAEYRSARGCPNRDTCPSISGRDPVDNWMDYSSCRRLFTTGQRTRMRTTWYRYRD
jgi:Pregnancy-associated plasma protein-A